MTLNKDPYADKTITQVNEFLNSPQAAEHLGDNLPELRRTAEGLIVPNVSSSGEITLPTRALFADTTPIFTHAEGMYTNTANFARFGNTQLDNAEDKLEAMLGDMGQAAYHAGRLAVLLEQHSEAGVAAQGGPSWHGKRKIELDPAEVMGVSDDQSFLAVNGTPYIALHPDTKGRDALSPITVVRDLAHVVRVNKNPLAFEPVNEEAYIAEEFSHGLAANHVAAKGADLAIATKNEAAITDPWKGMQLATGIDQLRNQYNSPSEPFAPKPELYDKVVEAYEQWHQSL
jgi:hypothetical protein